MIITGVKAKNAVFYLVSDNTVVVDYQAETLDPIDYGLVTQVSTEFIDHGLLQ